MLCSVVKHAGSGSEHERIVGRNTRLRLVFLPSSWVQGFSFCWPYLNKTLFPEEKARWRKIIKGFSSSDDPRRVIPVDLHSFLWHENVVTSHNCRTQKLAFLVARRFRFNQVPIDFGWVPTKFHFMWWADFSFNDYFPAWGISGYASFRLNYNSIIVR